MAATFFWVTLYLNHYHEVGVQRARVRSIFCTAYIVKMILTIAMFLYFIFLALSRVYLGEHSYNQVVYGSTLGLTLAVGLHYTAKIHFKRLPHYLRQRFGIMKETGTFAVPNKLFTLAGILLVMVPCIVAHAIWWQASTVTVSAEVD